MELNNTFNVYKKTIKSLAGILILALSSCSSVSDNLEQLESYDGEITFTSNIKREEIVTTRVVNNVWESKDYIGVYGYSSKSQFPEGLIYHNKQYITNGDGKFTAQVAGDGIHLEKGKPQNFIAYYPYKNISSLFQYDIDLENQASFNKLDVLYASNLINIDSPSQDTKFVFHHALAKLIVLIEAGNGITSLNDLNLLEVKGVNVKGNLNLKDGRVLTEETTSSVRNIKTDKTDKIVKLEIILLPGQSLKNIVMRWSTSGKSFTWSPKGADVLGGMKYTYRLQTSLDGNVVIQNPEGDIEDWNNTNGGDITLYPEDDSNSGSDKTSVTSVDKIQLKSTDLQGVLPINTINEEVSWRISSSAGWLGVDQVMGTGSTRIGIRCEENTSNQPRTGILSITADNTIFEVKVTQEAYINADLEEVVVMKETFGINGVDIIDFKYNKFNEYKGFATKGVVFDNKGSRMELRGKTTTLSGEIHAWFPAFKKKNPYTEEYPAPTLNIKGIDTTGLTDIELSFDITGDIGSRPINTDFMVVELDGKAIEVPSYTLTNAENNRMFTTTIKITHPFSELEFRTDDRNFTGIRFDNIVIKGKKL